MRCAACGNITPVNGALCDSCGADPALDGRYRLEEVVGRNVGTTYRATRISDDVTVIIKELVTEGAGNGKSEQLFEREARVLKQLDHPAIPAHLDSFTVQKGADLALYLVMQHLPGKTLAEEMESRRYTEDDVMAVLAELCGILEYLHALRPAVVHRDLKPSNIIRRTSGHLAVVDFGCVQDAVRRPGSLGTTVAGTFGYMAPEAMRGEAVPRSDLYSLGAVGVELLTRQKPHELLADDGSLNWAKAARVGPGTQEVLTRALAGSAKDRIPSATEFARLIQNRHTLRPKPAAPVEKRRPRLQVDWKKWGQWSATALVGGAAVWFFFLKPPAELQGTGTVSRSGEVTIHEPSGWVGVAKETCEDGECQSEYFVASCYRHRKRIQLDDRTKKTEFELDSTYVADVKGSIRFKNGKYDIDVDEAPNGWEVRLLGETCKGENYCQVDLILQNERKGTVDWDDAEQKRDVTFQYTEVDEDTLKELPKFADGFEKQPPKLPKNNCHTTGLVFKDTRCTYGKSEWKKMVEKHEEATEVWEESKEALTDDGLDYFSTTCSGT